MPTSTMTRRLPPRPAFRPRCELLDEFRIAAQPGPLEIFRQTGPSLRCLADHAARQFDLLRRAIASVTDLATLAYQVDSRDECLTDLLHLTIHAAVLSAPSTRLTVMCDTSSPWRSRTISAHWRRLRPAARASRMVAIAV
jgi:hypothetical protein